ncbi:MAG: uracil-DNA glycosylase [Nitrospirae bacterium]|nr:uracil-DNA glycosylase [Nitrospirota bacterium]MBI3595074.1 uracil-DNA glycosylase [Nitrospirota bacterium]
MSENKLNGKLRIISEEIVKCRKCRRLNEYREKVSQTKKRAYRNDKYWGKPVVSFGDVRARLLIIGLAPAAHGGNRTGRIFTGDSSGDFLFDSLCRFGFSNQPVSCHSKDGLRLIDTYISAVAHCAPPENKLLPEEIENCRPFLVRELEELTHVKAILTLGHVAFNQYLKILKISGKIDQACDFKFGHGATFKFNAPLPTLFSSYHPSQQNTRTGRLTRSMFDLVICQIRNLLDQPEILKTSIHYFIE